MHGNNIIKLYEENGALLRGHFLLSSGLHSDAYLQSERVMQYPNIAEKIVKELAAKLKDIDFDSVVSPAVGGIRFGYELARQLGKKTVFTERVDGVMNFRRGFSLEKGEKVIVAEDVVTTGKSTKECVAAVLEAGGVVVAITSIIDRSGGAAGFNIPFFPAAIVEVNSFEPANCPVCKKGEPLVKPGSRVFGK